MYLPWELLGTHYPHHILLKCQSNHMLKSTSSFYSIAMVFVFSCVETGADVEEGDAFYTCLPHAYLPLSMHLLDSSGHLLHSIYKCTVAHCDVWPYYYIVQAVYIYMGHGNLTLQASTLCTLVQSQIFVLRSIYPYNSSDNSF